MTLVVERRPLWSQRGSQASILMFYKGLSINWFSFRWFYCSEASANHADIEFLGVFENLTSTVTTGAKNHAVSLRIEPFRESFLLHFPLPRHHPKDGRF